MDASASKAQQIGKTTLFIDLNGSKIPCSIPRYKIHDKKIYSISFSSTSPDILYILASDDEIFSLRVSTLTLTKMTITVLYPIGSMRSLVCHGQVIYIAQYGGAVYRCTIEGDRSLSITTRFYHMRHYISSLDISMHVHLYLQYFNSRYVDIIDSDTMTLLSTISLRHYIQDIAISKDNHLHVATDNGVHIYTTDGIYSGQSYLDGERCVSITSTKNGYNIIGMMFRVAIISSDLTSICYVSTADMSYYNVRNAVDNSLAIVDKFSDCFVLVPPEVYQPPFSLFSLCMSTILLHVDELPVTLLPPQLYQQIAKCL